MTTPWCTTHFKIRKMNSNRGSLPTEIYLCILQQVDKVDLCKHALVCKAWLPLVQTRLYSRVHIKHYKQLVQFYETIWSKPQLGKMVKSFIMDDFIRHSQKRDRDNLEEKVANILTDIISTRLPNLETLQDHTSITCSPVLHALVDSQLNCLKSLGIPSFDEGKDVLATYVSCAILLKDRLENLLISDKTSTYFHDGELFFDRLYCRLGQFSRLREITMIKMTEDWMVLVDNIAERCPSLEKITLKIRPNYIQRINSNNVSIDAIRNFVPSTNIKSLKADLLGTLDEKILAFVMHKFPQLDECTLGLNQCLIQEANQQVLEQFLHYISKVKKFKVGQFALAPNAMIKTMGDFWSVTSTYGKESVHFYYADNETKETLTIGKERTKIIYILEDYDYKHIDFLKENGKFLEKVGFTLDVDRRRQPLEKTSLPDDFMAHTFAYCPFIRGLFFANCVFTPLGILPSEKHCLDETSFVDCSIYKGALESLSIVLSEVKHLLFVNVLYIPGKENFKRTADEVINMPHTKVDLISFGLFRGQSRYIKVSNTTDKNHYYCVLHFGETDALPSTEKEFLTVSKNKRIRVRCKTNPMIKSVFILPDVEFYGL